MTVSRLAGIALATAGTESSTETSPEVDKLIAALRDEDEIVRTNAWVAAGEVGAPAVGPLADLMLDAQPEVARAAKRALWQVARHSGRPGAESDKAAVVAALLTVLAGERPDAVRREVMWMLSEIGGDESVAPLASLLSTAELREDARMCVERIPGTASLDALKSALDSVPQDFKANIAESLRKRGVEVPEFPSVKLAPSRATSVQAM
ncbi:MAG: HEAT repeat domain-containing protein [Candidatus Hydrogenedentes bacterium]|nr:HEAT repeat domain-containing protein [Candidatus Hydrogenedentota bacterium]